MSDKAKKEKAKRDKIKNEQILKRAALINDSTPKSPANNGKPLAIGFYVNWDDSSYTSLKENINSLDWLVPEWIRLSDDAANPLALDIDRKALDLIEQQKPGLPVLIFQKFLFVRFPS